MSVQFVAVLNSKKVKLREFRDQITKLESKGKSPVKEEEEQEEEEEEEEELDRSSENTELYEGTDEEHTCSKEDVMQIDPEEKEETSDAGPSKKGATSRGHGRKKTKA